MYKHYITIDENNNIIDIFSDGLKQASESNILIRESDQRHVYLNDFEFNPNIIDSSNNFKYKYIDNQILQV